MTPTRSSTARHRLEVVPGGGPMVAQRVLLADGAEEGTHLLSWHAEGAWTSVAVEVVACPHVPAEVVAVSDELAVELELDPARPPTWRLDRVRAVPARTITLELPTERDVRDAARDVARSPLVGRLLWLPPDGREMWLPVDGDPHRVREVDLGGRSGVVAELTQATKIELYAPAARAGVDVVVLADRSGSMAVDDLPLSGERALLRGRPGWVRRMDALKEALNDLLTMRLQVSGRASQLALLEFDETVTHRFPRDGGMVQLDASSPRELVDEFRQAVALLRASGPSTLIGNALHEAANLLYQHGRPGNDKLIVLVSDGAEWSPAGEDGTGEMVHAVDEPVSLMAHLHRDMGIRLHAVGISTEDLFRRRGTFQDRPALVPNHSLLGALVKVGGGDPTTIGGMDALEQYFSGLGSGIVHRVADRVQKLPPAGAPLQADTVAALRRLAGPDLNWDTDRAALQSAVSEQLGRCADQAERVLGRTPWPPRYWAAMIKRDCGRTVTDDDALCSFLLGISGALAPDRDVVRRDIGMAPWSALTDDLKNAVTGAAPDYGRLSRVCGDALATAAQAQVAVMNRVRDGLSDLCDRLAGAPDAGAGILADAPVVDAPVVDELVADDPVAVPVAVPAAAAPTAPRYEFRYVG